MAGRKRRVRATELYREGAFTSCNNERQLDGSRLITCVHADMQTVFKFRVRNLHQEREEILEDEELEVDVDWRRR